MKKFNFQGIVEAREIMKVLSFLVIVAFIHLSSAMDVNAQTNLTSGSGLDPKHPAVTYAKQIDVQRAEMGVWNRTKVITTLNQKLNSLDKNSPDPVVQFKVTYLSTVLSEVVNYSIAPELSTLLTLQDLSMKFRNNPVFTNAFMKSLYINTTSTF